MPASSEIIAQLPIIFSLILIEGLLSVDNILGIAALAKHLPPHQQRMALNLGMLGAYGYRVLCIIFITFLSQSWWVRVAGAGYLIYLMCSELTKRHGNEDGEEGHSGRKVNGFWHAVASIQLMDLSLSVDNVIAARAMSDKTWVVIAGVFIGILALRFLAGIAIKLIEKYPILEKTAFLLIGFVGLILLSETFYFEPRHIHLPPWTKFAGIVVITAATLIYSQTTWLQKLSRPFIFAAALPMRLFAAIVGGLFFPIKFIASRLFLLFRRPTPI